jgi:hypothetical protein
MCTMTMMEPKARPMGNREHPRPSVRRSDGLTPAQRRRVRHVRTAIRAGEYENELKLEVAVDRLLAVLARR